MLQRALYPGSKSIVWIKDVIQMLMSPGKAVADPCKWTFARTPTSMMFRRHCHIVGCKSDSLFFARPSHNAFQELLTRIFIEESTYSVRQTCRLKQMVLGSAVDWIGTRCEKLLWGVLQQMRRTQLFKLVPSLPTTFEAHPCIWGKRHSVNTMI